MCKSYVGVDETGIWREDRPGYRMHWPWGEITRIIAYTLDCITRIDTVLEFDHECGHVLDISNNCAGFDVVAGAVGKQYSLPNDWYAAAENLGVREDSVVV